MIKVDDMITSVSAEVLLTQELVVLKDPLEASGRYPADPSHAVIANFPSLDDPDSERVRDIVADSVSRLFPTKPP